MVSTSVSTSKYCAEQISELLDGRRSGCNFLAKCPAHDDRSPSLSIKDGKDGRLLLKCFGGCAFKDILAAINLGELSPKPFTRFRKHDDEPTPEQLMQCLQRRWNEATPITSGDPVDQYLRGRSIFLDRYPSALRYHSSLLYRDGDEDLGNMPALIARLESPSGELFALHRIYLTPDGNKADVPKAKKLMGRAKGGSIRLYHPTEVLAVAEGIETALAVHVITGYPVWAAYSSDNMKKLMVPDEVRQVVICADNDRRGTGQQAAASLGQRLAQEGKCVKIAVPPGVIPDDKKSIDWLDILNGAR